MDVHPPKKRKELYPAQEVINKGAPICEKLKRIYYETENWGPALAQKVALKFSELKVKSRAFFPNCKNDVEFLTELEEWGEKDIRECLDEIPTGLSPETVDN